MCRFNSGVSRILAVVLLTGVISPGLASDQDANEPPKPAPPVARIVISPETTHFTEPLQEDGLVDVVEAVNRHFGQNISPEHNAAVVLYEVLGPSPAGVRQSDEFFKTLGMSRPPENGDYFQEYGTWQQTKGRKVSLDDFNRAMAGPWKRNDLPEIYDWLEASRRHLDRIAEGTKRPDYFSPLIPPTDAQGRRAGMVNTLLPGVQMSRALARAMLCRGMLLLGEGSHMDAWRDFFALHRLGRQIGRSATLIEHLVGVALETMALEAETRWIEHVQPGVKLAARVREELQSLPEISSMADAVDITERAMYIDSVLLLSQNRINLGMLAGANDGVPPVLQQAATALIDWNSVLRKGNQWYDRMAAAMRLEDRQARQAMLRKVEQELKQAQKEGAAPGKLALAVLPGLASPILTDAYSSALAALLLPGINAAQHAEDRQRQNFDNLLVTLTLFSALAASGEFPERLDQLVPQQLMTVPIDRFSGSPLKYRRTADGFELYSVGKNETDDGGRTFGDEKPGDDLVVRISLAKTAPAN